MIVFNNGVLTEFSTAYNEAVEGNIAVAMEVELVFSRFDADGTKFYSAAIVTEIDCFNNTMTMQTTVDIPTGEYALQAVETSEYNNDDYSEDYAIFAGSLAVFVDNAIVSRGSNKTIDNKGVVSWD